MIECNGKLYAGTDNGLYVSDSGEYWTPLIDSCVDVLCIAAIDSNIFVGTTKGIFRYTSETTCTSINTDFQSDSIHSLAVYKGKLFAGVSDLGIFTSSDHGLNWENCSIGIPVSPTQTTVTAFTVCKNRIFAATREQGIFFMENSNNEWISTLLVPSPVTCMVSNNHNIFAGTEDGRIFMSDDDGSTWVHSFTEIENSSSFISLNESRSIVFAATNYHIFFSIDDGITWKLLSTGMSPAPGMFIYSHNNLLFSTAYNNSLVMRQLSELIKISRIEMTSYYELPVTYYDFILDDPATNVTFHLYCNNIHILSTNRKNELTHISAFDVSDSIENITENFLDMSSELTFHVVTRSDKNQIVGVSDFIKTRYELAINTKASQQQQNKPKINFYGSYIDCSSIKENVQLNIFSLNGKKVWKTNGNAFFSRIPASLPKGTYVLKATTELNKELLLFQIH